MSSSEKPVQAVKVEEKRKVPNKWITEQLSDDLLTVSSLEEIYYATKSKFQDVDVVRLGSFGRCLLLDGKMQSSEHDEWIYHETLVHPAMLAHQNPKSVFIGGGGEGATLREVLRHKSVERCVMVDIDDVVIDTSKKYLLQHHDGAYDDKRLDLQVTDAGAYIDNTPDGSFDVIVLDLADPVAGGPCYQLYTKSFYEKLSKKLRAGGVLVTQSGPGGLGTCEEVFMPVQNTLRKVFKHVQPYVTHIPSFIDVYAFTMASNDVDVTKLSSQHVDTQIQQRLDASKLQHYDGTTHVNMTNLPKYLRTAMEKTDFVITEGNFAYIY